MKASEYQIGGNHYKSNIEPWDAMKAWMTKEEFRGFLRGTAIKYLARAGKKGSYLEDIQKANHYLIKLIEELEQV